jgi:hypothetical protein
MQDEIESSSVDFLTLVDWWNLGVLPVVLVGAVAAMFVFAKRRGPGSIAADGSLAVWRISLVHLALAIRSGIFLTQELLSMRTMGISESPIILMGSGISVVINSLLGLALLGRSPWRITRWLAIVWYSLLAGIAGYTAYWIWQFEAVVEPSRWPEQAVTLVLPWVLLVAMFVPRVRRVFGQRATVEASVPVESAPESPAGRPWVSGLVVVFLLIICSTILVESADWIHRTVTEPGELP